MFNNPKEFYEEQIVDTQLALNDVKRRLLFISLGRLVVFLATVGIAYFFRATDLILGLTILVGFIAFLVLVSIYTNLKAKRNYYRILVDVNTNEIAYLSGNLTKFKSGNSYVDPLHPFAQDMDLFGNGSLFQAINRTGTKSGEELLASILKSNDTTAIVDKQRVVQELAVKAAWRQNFQVNAVLVEKEEDPNGIVKLMKNYTGQLPSFIKFFPIAFTLISFSLIVLASLSLVEWGVLILPLILGLLITAVFLAKVNRINRMASKLTGTFVQYGKILDAIESETFQAAWLLTKQSEIKTDGKKASILFEELGKNLSSLDQRNNIFFALLANGYVLWDLRYASRIENWILTNQKTVEVCFETIAFFDAYISFGNYSFNHPEYVFPLINDDQKLTIRANNLGHPLLKSEKRVDNNFEIHSDQFFIITGANMAGKSTFLRTVGTSIILANSGLPVCAKSFEYSPIQLISSMRSSDSLQDDESYFFAELKRLKFIVDEIKTSRYFIILDEILKGTNSKDKEEGSKKFVQRLVATNSTGIIATHDLSLCQLESELPQIRNHYFDAEIVDDELYFDYTFKDGVCKNMNASFLLKKMGIV